MYLPGKCNKTFKSGEAGSFVFEDGKVRPGAAPPPPPPPPPCSCQLPPSLRTWR
jgi:hypothetical protein